MVSLVPLEGGDEIDLADGKITVGRGPFLRIIDKRVSRCHAIIEVTGSKITIQPIHTNSTFYKSHNGTKFEPLQKNKVEELHNDDCIAFLPNDLVFQVKKKDGKINSIEEQETERKDKQVKEDNNLQIEMSEEKKELKVLPLKKTRKLPSWMTNNKEKTPRSASKKSLKIKSRKVESSPETPIVAVATEKQKKENYDKKGCAGDMVVREDKTGITESLNSEEGEQKILPFATEEEEKKKRKRVQSDENDTESTDELVEQEKVLLPCPYGKQCYRKNPAHFQEYSHNMSTDQSKSEEMSSEDESELPECPYGTSCYRRNPQHHKEYRHTTARKTLERRAKKPRTEDDDDGPNDYDYDDSFINDESESSCEPSDNEDSDWQPEGNDTGDEDISQLLSEAKTFT